MKNKYFWYLLMTGAVALWIFAAVWGLVMYSKEGISAWYLCIGLILLHGGEVPLVIRMLNGYASRGSIAARTFLFGFTWWVPAKMGFFNEEGGTQ